MRIHKAMLAKWVIPVAISAAIASTPVVAHHSFAMFDMKKTVELRGVTVVQFKWANPHVFLVVTDGTTRYIMETASPNNLGALGWKFNTLKGGEKIDVAMNPLRNGKPGGSLVSVTLPDGRKMGGGGPGDE